MIRRPPRSTPLYSSAASDVYKRQLAGELPLERGGDIISDLHAAAAYVGSDAVSYTHLRAHETKANLVCRLPREKKNALLKILEEPPPRVIFIFATTEPQKIQ